MFRKFCALTHSIHFADCSVFLFFYVSILFFWFYFNFVLNIAILHTINGTGVLGVSQIIFYVINSFHHKFDSFYFIVGFLSKFLFSLELFDYGLSFNEFYKNAQLSLERFFYEHIIFMQARTINKCRVNGVWVFVCLFFFLNNYVNCWKISLYDY